MAAPPRSPEPLLDELVEEVLLRVPPNDPKSLLRAALVCKRWCRIVSDPGFRRRFRELHGTPPLLGFVFGFSSSSRFIPTCSFRPPPFINGPAIDARHGRVLLHNVLGWSKPLEILDSPFEIWNPITGSRKILPLLPRSPNPKPIVSWNAAILRRGGHSLVVFVGTDSYEMFSYVYSSESSAWSERVSSPGPADVLGYCFGIASRPSTLVENALYFVIRHKRCILKYDLGTREISLVDQPWSCAAGLLMTTERGGLGLAYVWNCKLFQWSRQDGPDGHAGWAVSRSIELKTLLPHDAVSTQLRVVGFAEDVSVIFLGRDREIFTIDLKSIQLTKVSDGIWLPKDIPYILPYVNFYTPVGVSSTAEGPRAGISG